MTFLIETYLPDIIHLIELIGILTIAIGSVKTFILYFSKKFKNKPGVIRLELGQALALGLEYKMGAEILKTVLIRDMNEILILGSIIILRALLSLLLHFEMKEKIM